MNTPARPTLRCIREDLASDWQDHADQLLTDNPDITCLKALHALRHPVIQKAVEAFPVLGESDCVREGISGLVNPMFWKLKTGRWRGAVFEDPDTGQAWLVAAGLRAEGQKTRDFYKVFMADVHRRGADHFLPTAADNEALQLEIRAQQLTTLEAEVAHSARDLLAQSLISGKAEPGPLTGLDGTRVALLEIVTDTGDDGSTELLIELQTEDWSRSELVVWFAQVVQSALCPFEDRWAATRSSTFIASLVPPLTVEELKDACSGSWQIGPGLFHAGSAAHVVHGTNITQQTIDGDAARSLCGHWFVPRQDHARLPICRDCLAVAKAIGIELSGLRRS